jgi:hypothetical protein
MATTVIQVQEQEKEIDIVYMAVKLDDFDTFKVKLRNGESIFLKPDKSHWQTYVIFEDGKIRFNRPVKIVDHE